MLRNIALIFLLFISAQGSNLSSLCSSGTCSTKPSDFLLIIDKDINEVTMSWNDGTSTNWYEVVNYSNISTKLNKRYSYWALKFTNYGYVKQLAWDSEAGGYGNAILNNYGRIDELYRQTTMSMGGGL